MAQGFEVDWDVLDNAGRRLLGAGTDATVELGVLSLDPGAYGDARLASAARGLGDAMREQAMCLDQALTGLGEGLRASARTYSDADALAAVRRMRMYLA